MATRSGTDIDLIWVHVDLRASQIDAFFAAVDTKHRARLPNTVLSINYAVGANDDPKTGLRQALVKIATTEPNMRDGLPPGQIAAIIRVFTENDHAEALALVTAPEWSPPTGMP